VSAIPIRSITAADNSGGWKLDTASVPPLVGGRTFLSTYCPDGPPGHYVGDPMTVRTYGSSSGHTDSLTELQVQSVQQSPICVETGRL